MTAKISLRDIHKSFGPKKVLRGVTLDIQPGESVVIIGGSGTGKSVAVKCILGLLAPDSGTIQIDGKDTTRLGGRARDRLMQRMGMLFQGSALFDSLPVWENVAFALMAHSGLNRREGKLRAVDVLAQVGLDETVADLSPAELSGGMQKRVGLARAIATQPEMLFFDEPTTGLDPIMADVINNLIVDRVKALGATALSITHDMASARKIGDRIAMLLDGQIVWQGPADQINSSGSEVVDQFVHGRADGPIRMPIRKL